MPLTFGTNPIPNFATLPSVRNFSIYYVVIGYVMEVRWFRYSRRMIP